MASSALHTWTSRRARALNKLLETQRTIRKHTGGNVLAVNQLKHAYLLALTAEFQAFSRDLHGISVHYLTADIKPDDVRSTVMLRFQTGRQLDSKNPNKSSLGSDFGYFFSKSEDFWRNVKTKVESNPIKKLHCDTLTNNLNFACEWRNAIAHGNQEKLRMLEADHGLLLLKKITEWRKSMNVLAHAMDRAVAEQLQKLRGAPRTPW